MIENTADGSSIVRHRDGNEIRAEEVFCKWLTSMNRNHKKYWK